MCGIELILRSTSASFRPQQINQLALKSPRRSNPAPFAILLYVFPRAFTFHPAKFSTGLSLSDAVVPNVTVIRSSTSSEVVPRASCSSCRSLSAAWMSASVVPLGASGNDTAFFIWYVLPLIGVRMSRPTTCSVTSIVRGFQDTILHTLPSC